MIIVDMNSNEIIFVYKNEKKSAYVSTFEQFRWDQESNQVIFQNNYIEDTHKDIYLYNKENNGVIKITDEINHEPNTKSRSTILGWANDFNSIYYQTNHRAYPEYNTYYYQYTIETNQSIQLNQEPSSDTYIETESEWSEEMFLIWGGETREPGVLSPDHKLFITSVKMADYDN